jgi:hypothetical protein
MTMQDLANTTSTRVPWNKGKVTGAKPPLRPKHVWSIRAKLQIEGRAGDLASFNLAIDSKLRGCDVVAIKVEDVSASGYTADRAVQRLAADRLALKVSQINWLRALICVTARSTGARHGRILCRRRRAVCCRGNLRNRQCLVSLTALFCWMVGLGLKDDAKTSLQSCLFRRLGCRDRVPALVLVCPRRPNFQS